MTADDGRAAVYAAEIAAFEGTRYEALAPFESLVALAATITAADWWPHGDIAIVQARSDARSSSARQHGSGRPTVRLAKPQLTPATVVHEFAHVLAGIGSGHGPVFRRAHVDIAGYVFGVTEAGWLLDAYAAMSLQPGRRSWSAPPVQSGTGGALAL